MDLEPLSIVSASATGSSSNSSSQEAPPPCPKCNQPQTKKGARSPGEWFCTACWLAESEAEARGRFVAQFLAELPSWTHARLKAAGMSRREASATVDRIPPKLKKALPIEDVRAMLAGQLPRRGFGIGSDGTGTGKTSAMAAILRTCLEVHARAHVEKTGRPPARWLTWRAWPSAVAWMRLNATADGFQDYVAELTTAPVLFLDDMGSERIKGSYVEDFAASQLDWIIDERFREELPTFYTCNLDAAGLSAFYGSRLASRLCGDNPLFYVSGLPDQRIARP